MAQGEAGRLRRCISHPPARAFARAPEAMVAEQGGPGGRIVVQRKKRPRAGRSRQPQDPRRLLITAWSSAKTQSARRLEGALLLVVVLLKDSAHPANRTAAMRRNQAGAAAGRPAGSRPQVYERFTPATELALW